MILNDVSLHVWAETGVRPFTLENVNPASIDLTFGSEYIDLATDAHCTLKDFQTLSIFPGDAILATTQEFIKMPEDCAGTIYLKSSLARQGLDHALAGWIDPGFIGQITLELHAHRLVILRPGQRIVQLVLNRMEDIPARSYQVTGRYNNQIGPTKAR